MAFSFASGGLGGGDRCQARWRGGDTPGAAAVEEPQLRLHAEPPAHAVGRAAAALGDGAAGAERVGGRSDGRARHAAVLVRDEDHARRGAAGGELDGIEEPGAPGSGERGAAARPQQQLGPAEQALGGDQVPQRLLVAVVAAREDDRVQPAPRRRDAWLGAEGAQQVGGVPVGRHRVVHRAIPAHHVAVPAALAVALEVSPALEVAHDVLDGARREPELVGELAEAGGGPARQQHQRPPWLLRRLHARAMSRMISERYFRCSRFRRPGSRGSRRRPSRGPARSRPRCCRRARTPRAARSGSCRPRRPRRGRRSRRRRRPRRGPHAAP